MIQIKITEEEIVKNPNDSDLGALVRERFYKEKYRMTELNQ
jgi:hypothetical protein